MIHDLEDLRSGSHTGGRRKIHSTSSGTNLPTQSAELLLDFQLSGINMCSLSLSPHGE